MCGLLCKLSAAGMLICGVAWAVSCRHLCWPSRSARLPLSCQRKFRARRRRRRKLPRAREQIRLRQRRACSATPCDSRSPLQRTLRERGESSRKLTRRCPPPQTRLRQRCRCQSHRHPSPRPRLHPRPLRHPSLPQQTCTRARSHQAPARLARGSESYLRGRLRRAMPGEAGGGAEYRPIFSITMGPAGLRQP